MMIPYLNWVPQPPLEKELRLPLREHNRPQLQRRDPLVREIFVAREVHMREDLVL